MRRSAAIPRTGDVDLGALPPDELVGGGGSGWTLLARARDDIEAHLLTGLLAEAGIEFAIVKDRRAPGAWLYGGSNMWAPSAVMVRKIQLEDARLVLAEIAFAGPAAGPPSVTPAAGRRRSLTWWAAAIALGALLTAVTLLRPEEASGRRGMGTHPAPGSVATG